MIRKSHIYEVNMKDYRQAIKDKKRIVVKIGSSSLQHAATGDLDYIRMDVLVRERKSQAHVQPV